MDNNALKESVDLSQTALTVPNGYSARKAALLWPLIRPQAAFLSQVMACHFGEKAYRRHNREEAPIAVRSYNQALRLEKPQSAVKGTSI